MDGDTCNTDNATLTQLPSEITLNGEVKYNSEAITITSGHTYKDGFPSCQSPYVTSFFAQIGDYIGVKFGIEIKGKASGTDNRDCSMTPFGACLPEIDGCYYGYTHNFSINRKLKLGVAHCCPKLLFHYPVGFNYMVR
jgi:hypothetical protein